MTSRWSSVAGIVRRQRWWAGRVVSLPVHLLVFALGVFFLVRLIPGDPVYTISGGQGITKATYEAARNALGLGGSTWAQLGRYFDNIIHLDLGSSMINGTGVLDEIGRRLPATLELALIALAGACAVTFAAGYLTVMRPQNIVTRAVRWYARSAGAVPDFCLGVAGIYLFYAVLRWAPAPLGRQDILLDPAPRVTSFPLLDAVISGNWELIKSMLAHLVLPELVLVLAYAPMLMKLFMRALGESVVAPATRFRISSGAPRSVVVVSVFRRALPSTVTMFGTLFGFMLGGAVIVEQLFSMPGMGQYAVQAVNTADLVALQGFLLVVAAISLTVFLLVDIVNMLLDPRRRPGAAAEGAS